MHSSAVSRTEPTVALLVALWDGLHARSQPLDPSPFGVSRGDFERRRKPPPFARVRDPSGQALCGECLRPVVWALGAKGARNAMFYPPQSRMDWHTNSDCPGLRRYYTYSVEGGGIFRYQAADGSIVDDIEPPGWVMREFEIPRAGLFWHTVYAPVARWSFGFLM